MTMQILFNQFAYTDRLKRGGFTDEQARASAEALENSLGEAVATKSDVLGLKGEFVELKGEIVELKGEIAETRAEIKAVKAETKADLAVIRAEIAASKVDIIRWVLVLNFALVSALFAAMRLLK